MLAEAEISRMKRSQIEYERKRAARNGLSLVDWVTAKQPRASLTQLVDELIQVCNDSERRLTSCPERVTSLGQIESTANC